MTIYLMNIPFAVAAVAIATVPLIIGMRHQSRAHVANVDLTHAEVFPPLESESLLELAA